MFKYRVSIKYSSPPFIPVIVVSSISSIESSIIISFVFHNHESFSDPPAFPLLNAAAEIHIAGKHKHHDTSCPEQTVFGDVVIVVEQILDLLVTELARLAAVYVRKTED